MTTWMMTLLLNDEIGNFLYVTYENTDADFSTWNRKTVFHLWKSQFIPLAQSCPILCNPMDCSTPGFPIHHQLPELAQTHIYRVGDAIQPLFLIMLYGILHVSHVDIGAHIFLHEYRILYYTQRKIWAYIFQLSVRKFIFYKWITQLNFLTRDM